MLPAMIYADNIKQVVIDKFKGYNHTIGAGDGEIFDMENLTSRYFPVLSPRRKRMLYRTLAKPNGIMAKDALCWVDGDTFYYGGVPKGTVTDDQKTFGVLGAYIVILPDKKFYNTVKDEFGSIEQTVRGTEVSFKNGTLYDEEAEANTVFCESIDFNAYFRAGDAITISGCTTHPENNKTPVIREISEDGHTMRFYEYVFQLDGEEGVTDYTEPGEITFSRTMPDMDYICENENRLWGCKGDEIYACKPGDIFNWNVFDGLDSDSYAASVSSAEDFTGCISYLGYPVFFKPSAIYKVYGSLPSNFQVMGSATMGVQQGAGKSLAIAGEMLFFLNRNGVAVYSGGVPALVSQAFGDARYKNAVAGSNGRSYYVSMEDESGTWHLFVYDTAHNLWHKEDNTRALGFAMTDNLFMLTEKGILITGDILDAPEEAEEEADVNWMCEFADFTDGEMDKKITSKILIRMELEAGAEASIFIRYDSVGDWEKVKTLTTDVKRSYYLPIIPKRADHYKLKITGVGDGKIYAIGRELQTGSPLRSRR